MQAGTSAASLLPPSESTGQSSFSDVADALEARDAVSASPPTEDEANPVSTAWDGNGGQQRSSYADAAAPGTGTSAEEEQSIGALSAQAEESIADQHAEHEDKGRGVARMTAMLAQLKAQLKQQAAENIQLEDMLKQADAQLSSAPVHWLPRLLMSYFSRGLQRSDERRPRIIAICYAQDMQVMSSS